MVIHWWIRQNVSKIMRRALSMNSGNHCKKKKSWFNFVWHSCSFDRAPSKSKFTYKCSKNSVIGSRYVYDSCWMTLIRSFNAFRRPGVIMTATAKYRRMCGHIVWMVFKYNGLYRHISMIQSGPFGWWTKTNTPQWINHVRCWSACTVLEL